MTQRTLEFLNEAINWCLKLLCVLKKKNKFGFYYIICCSCHMTRIGWVQTQFCEYNAFSVQSGKKLNPNPKFGLSETQLHNPV